MLSILFWSGRDLVCQGFVFRFWKCWAMSCLFLVMLSVPKPQDDLRDLTVHFGATVSFLLVGLIWLPPLCIADDCEFSFDVIGLFLAWYFCCFGLYPFHFFLVLYWLGLTEFCGCFQLSRYFLKGVVNSSNELHGGHLVLPLATPGFPQIEVFSSQGVNFLLYRRLIGFNLSIWQLLLLMLWAWFSAIDQCLLFWTFVHTDIRP